MSLIEFAKNELKYCGYIPLDVEQENGPNKWIQENILEILELISKQEHSGASINYLHECLNKLILYRPLTPLTGNDDEWTEVTDGIFQNKRLYTIFKKNNVTYNSEGYIFWHWNEIDLDEDEEGYPGKRKYKSSFVNTYSRKLITFPYKYQDPEYIEVTSYEVNKETDEPEPGSGWWTTIYPDQIIENTNRINELLKSQTENNINT